MSQSKCTHCGACENHVRCSCCGFCRSCGQFMAAPYYPYFPYYTGLPNGTITGGLGFSSPSSTVTYTELHSNMFMTEAAQ
jgi:hypothetical protein